MALARAWTRRISLCNTRKKKRKTNRVRAGCPALVRHAAIAYVCLPALATELPMKHFLILLIAALALASCKQEEAEAPSTPAQEGVAKIDIRVITVHHADYMIRTGSQYITGQTTQDTTLQTFHASPGDSIIAMAVINSGPQEGQGILIRAFVNDSLFDARYSALGACSLRTVVPAN
jgi:hypothetical protein